MPTGRRIYEEIWSMAQILLKKPSKFSNPWWEAPEWRKIVESRKAKGTLEPFVLKFVDLNNTDYSTNTIKSYSRNEFVYGNNNTSDIIG